MRKLTFLSTCAAVAISSSCIVRGAESGATQIGIASDDAFPVWSSTGASNVAGSVTVSDSVETTGKSKRFLLLRVAY